jgi:hypothetical protein
VPNRLFALGGLDPLLEHLLTQALLAEVTELIDTILEERNWCRKGHRDRELAIRLGTLMPVGERRRGAPIRGASRPALGPAED